MASITFNGVFPTLYSYPKYYASYPPNPYLNVYSFNAGSGFLRGANFIVSGGVAVRLTTTQLQTFANSIRRHIVTGQANTTIGGVTVATHDANSVDVTVSGNTINLPNSDAAELASRVLRYTVTGAEPQQTGSGPMNFYDLSA